MSKSTKFLIIIFSCFLISVYFNSCDDSGVATHDNNLTFSFTGLKHLNPQTDGLYEAWIAFAYSPELYVSCGKFNIDEATGNIVDTTGTPVLLKLRYRPYNFSTAQYGLITIDPPGFSDTANPPQLRILAGDVSVGTDYLTANLRMNHSLALDSIIKKDTTAITSFMLFTPTDTSTVADTNTFRWFDGIWMCDSTGNSGIMGLATIADASPWIYEAWINKTTDNTWYKIGRFKNPNGLDDDGAGPFAGPRTLPSQYQSPGEDWLLNSPPINDLRSSNYNVVICIEPAGYNNGLTGHFIQLFRGSAQSARIQYPGQMGNLPNVTSTLPTASIKISIN